MSSPSQPFNNSAFAPAVSSSLSPMAPAQGIDAPSPSTSLSALLPQIASSTSGLGLTPGTNPFLALQSQTQPAGGNVAGVTAGQGHGGAAAGSVRSAATSHTANDAIGIEGCLRGLEEAGRMVDRALEVRRALDQARQAVFGVEGSGSVESLQLEYNQLITALYLLSSTTLFGALPLPLPLSSPTVGELTGWCESRAALEFSRREGVKSAAKVVLDVFKGQGQAR